jgi:hypothetical protein
MIPLDNFLIYMLMTLRGLLYVFEIVGACRVPFLLSIRYKMAE